jgi:hypothetical protein
MKLHVIYKGQTVDISYDQLYLDKGIIDIRFSNPNAQSCKFLTQYLDANRIHYILEDREDHKEIIANQSMFALALSTKDTYRHQLGKDNLYDAIIEHNKDIALTYEAITKFESNVNAIDDKLADMQDDLSNSEYARSIDNITKEILEFKRCKQLEALALAKEHLDVSRGTIPVVETLKVAYHVSELLSKDEYKKLIYIQEYLNDKSKLSKQEEQYLEMLCKLKVYEYPEVIKEIEAIGREKFNEYYDKALKFVEKDEDLKQNIEEKLNEIYQ